MEDIRAYRGSCIDRSEFHLFIHPHRLLEKYIANYMITCPVAMTAAQMVMPTASNTLVYAFDGNRVRSGLRGVNTRAVNIGNYASEMKIMLLIEFHPGGLFSFTGINQRELKDGSFQASEIEPLPDGRITRLWEQSDSVGGLIRELDYLFLAQLRPDRYNPAYWAAMELICRHKGIIGSRETAAAVFYSEKQLNRFFQEYLGTNTKSYAAIVRINHAIRLLADPQLSTEEAGSRCGYYDIAHFIRDFRRICGITPGEYRRRMSVFYSDPYKIEV